MAAAKAEFKDGDWNCVKCGDHQFERNAFCRSCGTPKPIPSTAEFKDGDWSCANCGDHQFAKNYQCRRCGTPKPRESTADFKPGDWNCPRCGDHQFEKNARCRRCDTPKPGMAMGMPGMAAMPAFFLPTAPLPAMGESKAEFKEGDWRCTSCGDHQFANNKMCRRCGAPKPGAPQGGPGGVREVRNGDWLCPQCHDHQFERNSTCRSCGAPKPGGIAPAAFAPVAFAAPAAAMAAGGGDKGKYEKDDWMCASCGDHQFARNAACRRCGAPKPPVSSNHQSAKPGDWICPNPACGDLVFEKNAACRRCGTPKAAVGGPVKGGMMGGPMMPMMASNMQTGKPGDWICPNPACQDLQFEKNAVCRRCSTPKPVMSTNQQQQKAGDWICPNPDCNDLQFAKNDACRRCGTAKPEGGRERSRSPR